MTEAILTFWILSTFFCTAPIALYTIYTHFIKES